MDIGTIISEADVRVPNGFDNTQKVTWLNEINNEFFDVVKIPKSFSFTTTQGAAALVVTPTDIRGKNIDKLHIGKNIFPSFLYQDVQPGRGYHTFDDATRTVTIVPTPTVPLPGIIKYFQISTTTFVTSNLTGVPDAPAEYHWVYILGLAEKIAAAMDDIARSSNYGQQYRAQLAVAQANYLRG